MSDYGLRISYDGNDVKTCSDLDCVVTSKYSNLKGSISGKGTKSVPSGTTGTVTISHNLGYIPSFRVLADPGLGVYAKTPYVDSTAFTTLYIITRADSTNAYIDITWDDTVGGSTLVVPYAYFIFIDKGNLN